jgi:hypothetical protein
VASPARTARGRHDQSLVTRASVARTADLTVALGKRRDRYLRRRHRWIASEQTEISSSLDRQHKDNGQGRGFKSRPSQRPPASV